MFQPFDVLKLAAMDFESLLTESFWCDFGAIYHFDSLRNVRCRSGPDLEPLPLFAPIILGYCGDEEISIQFVFIDAHDRFEAEVVYLGESISAKEALFLLYSLKGKARSLTPYGLLSCIITDLERRAACVSQLASTRQLQPPIFKVRTLLDIFHYENYLKALHARYRATPSFLPSTWFNYVLNRFWITVH